MFKIIIIIIIVVTLLFFLSHVGVIGIAWSQVRKNNNNEKLKKKRNLDMGNKVFFFEQQDFFFYIYLKFNISNSFLKRNLTFTHLFPNWVCFTNTSYM